MNAAGAVHEGILMLTQTLLHFVWQGAALGLAAMACSLALRRRAQARAWWLSQLGVFVLMFVCPIATLAVLARAVPNAPAADFESTLPFVAAPTTHVVDEVYEQVVSRPGPGLDAVPAGTAAVVDTGQIAKPVALVQARYLDRAAPWISGVYAAGVALMLVRLMAGVRGGRGLRKSAQAAKDPMLLAAIESAARALGMRVMPTVALSARVAVATVVGFVRPVVLLPMHIQTGFSPAQIEMLLLHEFAHLRRYDHWVALLQRLGETLFFFHPAVWYVSRQISAAREHCCDDLVIRAGRTPVDYAKTLLHAGEQAAFGSDGGLAAMQAARGPSQLRRRIARMLGSDLPVKAAPSRLSAFVVTALIAASVVAVAAVTQEDSGKGSVNEPSQTSTDADSLNPTGELEAAPIVVAQATAEPESAAKESGAVQSDAASATQVPITVLMQQLASGDPWVSKLAALEMGKSGDRFYVDKLTELLSKESAAPEVRAAAAEALGALGDPRAVPYLVSALRYSASEQLVIGAAAQNALGRIKDDSVLATLKIAVADDNLSLRGGAYIALGWLGTEDAYHVLADAGLRDSSEAGHLAANELARAARKAPNADKVNVLIAALKTKDSVIPERAMLALVLLDSEQARQEVIAALKSGAVIPTDDTLQTMIEKNLIERDEVRGVLIGMLLSDKLNDLEPDTLGRLSQSIIASGDMPESREEQAALYVAVGNYVIAPTFGEAAVDPLIRALARERGHVSGRTRNTTRTIVDGLGAIGDPKALEALGSELSAMSDEDAQRAVMAIGKIGTPAAIPILIGTMKSRFGRVRSAAALELGRFDDQAAVDALFLSLRDLDDSVRGSASQALSQSPSPHAVVALLNGLNDMNEQVQTASAAALGQRGGAEALDGLIKALDSDSPEVLSYVAGGLIAAGDVRAIGPLEEKLAGLSQSFPAYNGLAQALSNLKARRDGGFRSSR